MFDEEKTPTGPEDPMRFAQRAMGVWNAAQSPGRQDRVNAFILQWNSLGRTFYEFTTTQFRTAVSARHRKQFWRRIETDHSRYL